MPVVIDPDDKIIAAWGVIGPWPVYNTELLCVLVQKTGGQYEVQYLHLDELTPEMALLFAASASTTIALTGAVALAARRKMHEDKKVKDSS